MGVFDSQILTAQNLIKRYGQSVVWNSKQKAANPSQPWKPGVAADTPHDVYICFVPKEDRLMRQLIQSLKGTEVKVGRLAGLMGAVDFEPSGEDTVTRDGQVLSIDTIDLLSPNGQKILYTIEFKG